MNIQTTNTPPPQTTIEVPTIRPAHVPLGSLFQHEGRIWRAVRVTETAVTGEWVPNADVTREELPIPALS